MKCRQAVVAVLTLALLPACQATRSGSTSIAVQDATKDEEVAIRKQEWKVEKAVQDVVITYDLEGQDLRVVIEHEGGLGETQPDFDLLLKVEGSTVSINKLLFLETNPEQEAILLGLFAHELGHALHYSRMSEADLVVFGEKYERFYLEPQGKLRPWAEAYEQFTDLTAIAHGYGTALIQQKIRSQDNVAKNHPPKVWNFYLKPDEIAALMADRAALGRKIDATLELVDLESLTRFAKALPLDGIPLKAAPSAPTAPATSR
jgi:hypothetical protein